ncbi:hypothetical protein AVEN_57858-1 [Araneus ventricosus]|uniref:Reverse transcriptase domain-containing protein n=1 Tax=Araneus ventricosus TaxID=182803 RepID=A0A4Y2HPE7_ARAVE|nr:hypothetical protein AVEN_57858-1 [Araneus ventricosus]
MLQSSGNTKVVISNVKYDVLLVLTHSDVLDIGSRSDDNSSGHRVWHVSSCALYTFKCSNVNRSSFSYIKVKVCNLDVLIFSNPLKKYKGAYNRFALLKKYKGVRLPQSGANSSGHKLANDALLHVTSPLEQARRQGKHAVLISLDIAGAFDSLQYPSIRDRFSPLSLFSNISETLLDTLRNRKVAMQTSEGPVLWEQTQGCPQGSCSGPAFWNIVADEILSVQWPQGVHLQAFADDFAFIVTDNTREGLRKLSKLALDKLKKWTDKNKLHVSMEKSSYVLFSKLVKGPKIKWGNQSINRKNHLKYLGVTIDHELSWLPHVIEQGKRAMDQY